MSDTIKLTLYKEDVLNMLKGMSIDYKKASCLQTDGFGKLVGINPDWEWNNKKLCEMNVIGLASLYLMIKNIK